MEEEDQESRHQRENRGSVPREGEGLEGNGGGVNCNEIRSFTCDICNKGFSSGKALGGHMRIHNLSRKRVHGEKQITADAAKSKTAKWVMVDGNPTCSVCGKTFSSRKSLFGHMRSHTEKKERKGIQSNAPIVRASSNSTSSSTLSDDLAVDLSRALRSWSVTAKRGRISSSCSKSDSGLEEGDEIEPRMQEAAYELMLLARGSPKSEQEVVADQIQEHPFNKRGREEELPHPILGNSDDVKIKKRNRKKVKLTELASTGEENKFAKCRKCNTSFPSHQSLNDHVCSSLQNSKNIQSRSHGVSATKEEHHAKTSIQGEKTGPGTVLESRAVEAMRGYECEVLNETFSNGQAFGDHKRSDWTRMGEAGSAQATSSNMGNGQNCSKVLSFDLNQIPAMDGEEGVQSDLFIPANIMTSSSYDSSC